MKLRFRRLALGLGLAFGLVAPMVAAPSPDAAIAATTVGTETSLPIHGLSDMAFDPISGNVLVTGGIADSELDAIASDGTLLARVHLAGADGIVVDETSRRVYVALHTADAIVALRAGTLTKLERFPLPPALCGPTKLAFAGGRLWFGFGYLGQDCGPGTGPGGIGWLDPTTGDTGTYSGLASYPFYDPIVASTPGAPDLLAAADAGLSPGELRVYDVSTLPPTPLTPEPDGVLFDSDFNDMAITPDGRRVLVPDRSNGVVQGLSLPGLHRAPRYHRAGFVDALDVSADGAFLGIGADDFLGDPDVRGYRIDRPVGPISSVSFANGGSVLPRGFVYNADASLAFVVTQADRTSRDVLHVLEHPTKADAKISFDALPSSVPIHSTFPVSGKLRLFDDADPMGQYVQIQAFSPLGYRDNTYAASVDASGRWSANVYINNVTGRWTFVASYGGDASHNSTESTVDVRALGQLTTLSLGASSTDIANGDTVTLHAHLGVTGTSDTAVDFYGSSAGVQGSVFLGSGSLDANGDAQFTTGQLTETTTFTAVWAGDPLGWEPATSDPVTVGVRAVVDGHMADWASQSGRFAIYPFSVDCGSTEYTGCPQYLSTKTAIYQYTSLCFEVQARNVDGTWTARAGWPLCGQPTYDGSLDVSLYTSDTSLIGVPLRIRAAFAGDAVNLAARAQWSYFKITSGTPATTTQHPQLAGEI